MKKIMIMSLFFAVAVWADETAEIKKLAAESLLLSISPTDTGYVAVGERGHVLISEDGGQTWTQSENVPTRATLTQVAVKGNMMWAVGHDTTIIHSADGGKTWELQFEDAPREVPLLSVKFLSESEGYAIGAYGTLMHTTDGGSEWSDDLISEELDYHLNDVDQTDIGTLIVAAEAGYMFRSEDQGATWQEVELPYPGSMFGVRSLGTEVIAFGLRGHVLRSQDEGVTWEEISHDGQDNLFGASQVNDDVLLLFGANGAQLRYHKGQITSLKDQVSGDDYAAGVRSGSDLILVGEAGITHQSMYQ